MTSTKTWPDLVIANGHLYPEIDRSSVGETYRQKTLLYRNLGNGRFADATAAAGPPSGLNGPRAGSHWAISTAMAALRSSLST